MECLAADQGITLDQAVVKVGRKTTAKAIIQAKAFQNAMKNPQQSYQFTTVVDSPPPPLPPA